MTADAPAPAPAEPPVRTLEGLRALWAALPAAVMVALTLLPSVAERQALHLHVYVAAAICIALVLLLSRRGPLRVTTIIRRQHYMQALTQLGVFVYWATAWAPVSGFAGLIAVQLAFAYQIEALVAWWRKDTWRLGFGPFPVIFSINLFMWFRDELFGWQLVMVALCYLAKHVIVWNRDGIRRHVFNPSSFGLAVISFGLLLTGSSHLTYGREIALTQEAAPYFIHVLFALGLIVQVQFRVVLVTASAAVATWLLGVIFLRVTGVYMFATTDIPAAVFLGMLLLITDPSTSPKGRLAKVLFGAAYGFLAFASFPLLEAMGSLGYYDKLLPVPFLNLLVRRFDGWGTALGARLGGGTTPEASPAPTSTARNLLHVGTWAAIFGLLVLTHAVGKGHPGRDITFWQRACADQRFRACTTYFDLLSSNCDGGMGEACHNLGVELLELERQGKGVEGRPSAQYFERACELGVQLSCPQPGVSAGGTSQGPPLPIDESQGPAAPPNPLEVMQRACDEGSADACHRMGDALSRGGAGLPADPARAKPLFQRGCELGSAPSCSSFGALEMQRREAADTEAARAAFEKACEMGDPPGCANLAGMYALAHGVPQDFTRAAELNDKACGFGLGVACARLAQAHAQGQGVAVDAAKAQELMAQACSLGFTPACGPG